MGKKLVTLVGIGAGYVLIRKQLRENPDSPAAKAFRAIQENDSVQRVKTTISEKSSEFVRRQGEALTDKVAEAIKERLFGVPPTGAAQSAATVVDAEPVEIELEIEEIEVRES